MHALCYSIDVQMAQIFCYCLTTSPIDFQHLVWFHQYNSFKKYTFFRIIGEVAVGFYSLNYTNFSSISSILISDKSLVRSEKFL